MNLMKFLISRKTFISMLFIALTLLGYISYKQLSQELLPNAELPMLFVSVSGQQEMDPQYMERQAIIPLEGAIGTLEGIDKIESTAQARQGSIIIYYNQSVEIKYAYLRLQEKVNEIKSSLPEEFNVNVIRVDIQQLSNQFMTLQIRGEGGVDRLRNLVDQKIKNQFENIDGIASVDVTGGREKSVEIIIDEEASEAYNITPNQIRNLIRQNSESKTYVGQIYGKDKKYFVNVLAEYTDVHELENIVVRRQGPIVLKDIAEIFVGTKEETSISRVNGLDAITMTLVRDTQVNLIELSHTTHEVVARLNEELKPDGLEIVVQSDAAEIIEANIDLIIQLALIGGGLAIVVLWIFLRNFKLVLIIAAAIPISIFTALNFFYGFEISLNTLTLVGMALAIGMLLDNSVVVLENIYRLRAGKKDTDTAVIQGTSEVWRATFAATLTTIVVFLPFVFSTDFFIKLIGRNVGVSIISTLLVSLTVALFLIPTATHYYLSKSRKAEGAKFQIVSQKNRLLQVYTLLLKSTLRFPARTIFITVVVFAVSMFVCLAISLNVLQEVETNEFNLYITMNQGSTLESTNTVVEEVEKRLEDLEEKKDIISRIYEEEAVVTIELEEDFEKIENRDLAEIKEVIEDRVDDIRLADDISFDQPTASGSRFRGGGGGGGGGNPGGNFERMMGMGTQSERVVIKGHDFDMMRNVAEDVRYYLEDLESMNSVRLSVSENRPELHLHFDTQLMSYFDVPLTNVSSELGSFQNEFSSGLTYKQGIEEYDIVIRKNVEEDEENTIDDLKELLIPSSTSGTFELQQLSRTIFGRGRSNINRVNQEKQIELTYQFINEVNDSKSLLEVAREEIDLVIANLVVPSGIAVEVIHEEDEFDEFKYLILAAVILIYMILASVFESLWLPFVILFSIPFAAMGSFFALIFTGNSLINANTLIGFLILLGIVVNNGIILIDYTRILRQRGFRASRALVMAGQARVRPILITAITTMIAMLPLALGKAEYVTQIGAPFAITVIGGLAFSTLCTLVFVPTVYMGLETSLNWIKKLNWKLKVFMLVSYVIGGYWIYTGVDTLLWQILFAFFIVTGVPAILFFLLVSLRKAKADFIKAEEEIIIKIQNLAKIYDKDMRFVREWKKGKQINEKFKKLKGIVTSQELDNLIWQIPALGGLVWFVYFYLGSAFWLFVLTHTVYFYVFFVWNIYSPLLKEKFSKSKFLSKIINGFYPLFYWGFPLFNLVLFFLRWNNITVVIFITIVWYLALTIYTTSNRLFKHNININRLTGRFARTRRRFYKFVKIIPVIGKKKNPFRALNGVSLDIGKGMFGLLGPNGAGKTTLMRIVCGILEQSYGKIWINGIDVNEKREELQGLIGYLPQEFGTYENMTAFEFLNYQAILKNIIDKEEREKMIHYVLSSVHMEEHKDEKIGSFSGGMKQRIGIAQILLHLPRILVVDEPTAGLDPRERIRFRNLLVELGRERVVIFSTHIIEDISSSCNNVAVLSKGELRYLGVPAKMADIAEGYVWQFKMSPREFETFRKEYQVVHHMRDGDKIRVRCISATKPHEEARNVRPSLEDSYIWLLKDKN